MPNIASRASAAALAVFAAVVFGIGPAHRALGADKAKIRWIRSIYFDTKGSGLSYPEGVACGDDYLFVADTGNRRLLRYSYRDDSVTAEAEFPLPKSYPIRVQVNSRGHLYFLDGREREIVGIGATGDEKRALKAKGLPSSAKIVPKSFVIGENDEFYILDVFSGRVLVLDADGQYLRHVPFPEKYGFFSDLAVDPQGNILLLDGVEAVLYSSARGADHFSPFSESLKTYMNYPTSLALDGRGVIYLVDQYGSGLALVGRQDGAFLGRRLGMGWSDSGLYYPSQICISRNGSVFIADRSNSRVQLFRLVEGGPVVRGDGAEEGERNE